MIDTVKSYFRRIALVVALSVGALVSMERPARAQFAVTDLPQIGMNLSNTLMEVAEMLKQLGVVTDQLDWMDTIMDYAGQIQGLLQDVGTLGYMYNSLQYQAETMKTYLQMIQNMENTGFDPSVIIALKAQVQTSYENVKLMIEQGMKILADVGISKADKMKMAEEYAANVAAKAETETQELQDEIDMLEATRGMMQFDNFISGKGPDEGIAEVGVLLGDETPEIETTSEEAFGADVGIVKESSKSGFQIFYILLGILLAFALIGTTVRYMRGDYRSEGGFMRIFAVIVAGAVLFGVLQGFMRL